MLVVEFRGETVTLGVEPGTGRVLSAAYRDEGPEGAPGNRVETFADFRDVSGVALPFKSASTFNGEASSTSTVESIILNAPIDAKQFERTKTP